jgi:hypothetical protein
LALLPVSAGSAFGQSPQSPRVTHFDAHIKHLHEATYEQYQNRPGVKVADEAAFNEMKTHLQHLYKNVKATHSYLSHGDQHVDVIPIDQQPSLQHPLLKNHKVQHGLPTLPGLPKVADDKQHPTVSLLTRHTANKDAHGHDTVIPPGHIPMRRITLAEMTKHRTLKDYLNRNHAPLSANALVKKTGAKPEFMGSDGYVHRHAEVGQSVNCVGGSSWINVWAPKPAAHNFSLSQQWYMGGTNSPGDPFQTVEGGWQVDPDVYGHNLPVPFTYWTADGYTKTGGYDVAGGFVQLNNYYVLGLPFLPKSDKLIQQPLLLTSSKGGAQYGFQMTWVRIDAWPVRGWFLLFSEWGLDPEVIGYYPLELFGNGQMSKNATAVAFGGEVTGQPDSLGRVTTGQMGSGAPAKAGWQQAAFHKNVQFLSTSKHWSPASLSSFDVDTNRSYTVDIHNRTGGAWGTYFFFGGPGGTYRFPS